MIAPQTAMRLSTRIAQLHPSPIREILSVIDRPGMISFAGGLPAAETFPEIEAGVVPRPWLQYGATEGERPLRARIAQMLSAQGLGCTPEQVLILSGSQQGIDLVGKLFVDAGTAVALDSPTYLAALQVFRYFGARFLPLAPMTSGDSLSGGERPALAYAIPNFQNPTGHCYTTVEREALARACDAQNIPLFEDDPYRDLVYDDCDRSPVCARLQRASWIYQGSFSKSLAPGLRLGFMVASPDLLPYLVRLKQAADLHSNRVCQWIVLNQFSDPARDQRLTRLAETYRHKRDVFAQELARHFDGLATWKTPPGGLFFWLRLTRAIDTRALLRRAIERGVAFMPGEPFFPDGAAPYPALRLNFSHADEAQIERGLGMLAALLAEAGASAEREYLSPQPD